MTDALAAQAYATLRREFSVAGHRGRGLFHEHSGGGRHRALAFNWSFAHAFAAAIDVYGLGCGPAQSEIDDLMAGLNRYWDERRGTGLPAYSSTVVRRLRTGAKYYDDNAWSGLNLMRLHRMDRSRPGLLAQVSAVVDFVLDEHRRQQSGAVHWQQQVGNASRQLGTVANAANAQLALRLYQASGEAQHLDLALAMYTWVNEYMRDPTNNLFWDHVTRPEGRVDTTQWSYNQGLMIGVNVLLFRTTTDHQYHRASVAIAEAALATFDLERLRAEPVEFAVILFRNLILLTTVDDDATRPARIRRRAEEYLQLLLPGEGERERLIERAAIVEMIAMLCWPADRYDLLV
ncbi:MAG TPA: glycoside hydrolase family 76 protein [Acidimicrobiales bacterium]|nr:glycoside hydrolase family 76 protein [Acidimicrobiales bacterium]